MKHLLLICVTAVFGCGLADQNTTVNKTDPSSARVSYTLQDLHKAKWIEGRWRGTDKTKPFYEIYQLTNDSTLEIISFEWNGKDSMNSSKTEVHWEDGAYYLGVESNWKVTEITDSTIVMIPHHKAANDIVWKYHDSTSWDAILNSSKETTEYHMQAYDPFSEKQTERR